MIKINIPLVTLNEINKIHKEYILQEIPKRWNKVLDCTATVNKARVVSRERNFLRMELERKSILIPTIEEVPICKEKCNSIIEMCTSSDLEKYAYTKEELFSCPQKRARLNEILLYVIGYNDFNTPKDVNTGEKIYSWNRHTFVDKLNIKVCPYCNRQYITSYYCDGRKRTTADTDHYYPKNQFPLLSMNINNLIPSCQICNSRMKIDKVQNRDERHLNPYIDESDSLKFKISFNSLEELYNFKSESIHIEVDVQKSGQGLERSKQSKKIFRIEEVYQTHSDVIYELKNNMKKYSYEKYKIFEGNYSGLFESHTQLEELAFSFNLKSLDEEPLTKLKQDIYNQIREAQGKT